MPYDQESTAGYFLTLTIQTIAVWKYSAVFCTINTFYVGVCRYTDSFIDDMKITLNEMDGLNKKRTRANSKEITIAMKLKFIEVMQFHIEYLE